jgi:hypothetical protein
MLFLRARFGVPLFAFLTMSCGGTTDSGPPSGSSGGSGGAGSTGGGAGSSGGAAGSAFDADTGDAPPVGIDAADCHAVAEGHPIEGANHLPVCDPTPYQTNPPSSGNHYGVWANYTTYTTTFRPGFFVHDLEHGAVVITYNCPGGCPDEVAAVQAFIDSLPADCGSNPPRRVVLLPYPDLDVRWAASAWGFTLKAACFDRAAFGQFYADHYNHGPEDICSNGVDPTQYCP